MRREVNWHVENVWPLVIIIVVLGVVVCPSGFPFRASIWRAACVRHGHSIRATRPLYCRKKHGLFSSHLSLFLDSFRLLTTLMFPLKRGLIHEAVSHWRFRECHGGLVNWKRYWLRSQCVASQLSWSSIAPDRGGHGFESRWSPDIFQASSFQLLKLEKFTAMITLHFRLQPQYKYEFHMKDMYFLIFRCKNPILKIMIFIWKCFLSLGTKGIQRVQKG